MTIEKIYKLDKVFPPKKRRLSSYERGILVQDGQAIATDGHILAVVPVTDYQDDSPGVISPEVISEGRKLFKKFSEITFSNNEKTTLELGGPSFDHPLDETGRFPNWPAVFPAKDEEPVIRIGLNARLLKTLSDALGTETLELAIYGAKNGIVVTPMRKEGDDVTRGMIMPYQIKRLNR